LNRTQSDKREEAKERIETDPSPNGNGNEK
jgi:hypothetical protein